MKIAIRIKSKLKKMNQNKIEIKIEIIDTPKGSKNYPP